MSRVEENQGLINLVDVHYNGKFEEVLCKIESSKVGLLMDISKSLAVIADTLSRDTLLVKTEVKNDN